MALGKSELARIHILKKDAAITDDEYRALLFGAAGVDSAADIETPDQYYRVISCLEKYLVSIGKESKGKPPQNGRKPSFLEAVQKRAERILGPAARMRMAGYLRKMGKKTLADCSDRELRRVMGFLSSVEREGKIRR